ncbi:MULTISPECIES: L-2-amino-thiazoline-4-carboxylic acid hydrolase [Desulfosediminicola]|uniref:L-2-amino-thiazoline-4-carboxylic acid hydrolase n=1 Tax=Desulfosediminicola TaxID=2886823 RepID=UPI0010ACE485|nr:L-2-amino-thiazoline-4-carboxylic acid hydrolase [Desulfosediminicola ganghwensis]
MITTNELNLTDEDYDKAFTEVSFLLDMFVGTIETFVGKSTPSLAVAAGRRMAQNMPIHLESPTPAAALAEFIRVFRNQQMEINGHVDDGEAVISLHRCPIRSVCEQRNMEIDGLTCQMFHYYIAGIMAELTGSPVRPKTVETGETCTFNLAFSRAVGR